MVRLKNYEDSDFREIESLLKETGLYRLPFDRNEKLKKQINHDPESIIVAKDGGAVVGCIFILYNPWTSFIYHLGVLSSYNGQGIATKLMNKAEKILEERGVERPTLFVEEDNEELLTFYKNKGWEVEGKVFDLEKQID